MLWFCIESEEQFNTISNKQQATKCLQSMTLLVLSLIYCLCRFSPNLNNGYKINYADLLGLGCQVFIQFQLKPHREQRIS